jgi:hypothetical protein
LQKEAARLIVKLGIQVADVSYEDVGEVNVV